MEAKFWPSGKRIKNDWHQSRINFSQDPLGTPFFDHRKNQDILWELKAEPVDDKLRRYVSNWLRHVTGMDSSRVGRIVLSCRANGRRWLGRALERMLGEGDTGLSRHNRWLMMMIIKTNSTQQHVLTYREEWDVRGM